MPRIALAVRFRTIELSFQTIPDHYIDLQNRLFSNDKLNLCVRRKTSVFPLVRHVSKKTTAILLQTPLTPNQLTFLSLISGLASAWLFSLGSYGYNITAAALLIISYVLDNCDGEIARAKSSTSEFGRKFDDLSDWWVHAAVFIGIGLGAETQKGDAMWWWIGLVAGLGATINYFVVRYLEHSNKKSKQPSELTTTEFSEVPTGTISLIIFVFRELFRADFCFLLLLLALLDVIWLILPAAAIGSQAYWMIAFYKKSQNFHV